MDKGMSAQTHFQAVAMEAAEVLIGDEILWSQV